MSKSPHQSLLSQIASDAVLDAAFEWLCKRRKDYPANADVWSLRFKWQQEKQLLQKELTEDRFWFQPQSRLTQRNGETINLWSARDALVLKALAIVLAKYLPVSPCCTHIKGHGGCKAAVRSVWDKLPSHRFVLKTDVKSYYASIDHHLLIEQLARYIKDRQVLNLLWQTLHRSIEQGGMFRTFTRGISRGCPLSPLMSAFFLHVLDEQMAKQDVFYRRYMDDIIAMTTTRWRLRRAVKQLNSLFSTLHLEKHPDKTFIGQIDRGFDFLGYHFERWGLTIAKQTWQRYCEKRTRLYEQKREASDESSRLGYMERWIRWARAGLEGTPVLPMYVGAVEFNPCRVSD